jgi:Ca-activated chloride channel family protein
MHWGNPNYLHLLWVWALTGVVLWRLAHWRQRRLQQLVEASALARLAPDWRPDRLHRRLLVWLAAALLIVLALARPQWGSRWEEVKRRGLDLLVALDTSRSMLAQDLKPTRLQQAKWGVRDLVQQLRGDRIGLVNFAGASYLQCPLTIDYAAFLMTLDDALVGSVPRGGTAIAQALETALAAFRKQSEGERVLLLISDGEDHEGRPLALLDELRKERVRIYAVGMGTTEGELLPAPAGQAGFQKDDQGRVIKSSLNEDSLSKLALETGGAYVRAVPGDTGLERLFNEHIKPLARQEGEARLLKVYEDRAGWFLAGALLLLAMEASWSLRRRGNRS